MFLSYYILPSIAISLKVRNRKATVDNEVALVGAPSSSNDLLNSLSSLRSSWAVIDINDTLLSGLVKDTPSVLGFFVATHTSVHDDMDKVTALDGFLARQLNL